jgi:hypothetical protein
MSFVTCICLHASMGSSSTFVRRSCAFTGRRKSTPAALDMALRTAEGKAAIEELINSGGKKQMVFGQYFGSTGKAAPPSGADKSSTSRFKQVPLGPMGTGPAMADKVINTVPEDEDTPMATVASPTSSSPHVLSPKVQSPHPPAMPPPAASSPHPVPASASAHLNASGALKPAAKRPMDIDMHVPAPAPAPPATIAPQPSVQAPPTPAPTSQPTPMQVEEEPPPAKQTKILALAQQLPNGMGRKYWSLADYSIVRKMYTGYASTVYQVGETDDVSARPHLFT